MRSAAVGASLTALVLVCCGSEGAAPEASPRADAYQAQALRSLEGKSLILRRELSKTCEKWMPQTEEPCDPEAVRADQLDCWLTKGLPTFDIVKAWRPRPRDSRILLEVNLCMEKRRWRKVKRGPDF